ncbi:MAG TPA: hypothetical protein VGF45_20130 [Polyangia bacterium]
MNKRNMIGLFFVALATLMYEVLLTRIFSVTMWYHFAFMAISVAMFGMTFGAVLVYLYPARFAGEKGPRLRATATLAFAVSVVVSFLAHVGAPYLFQRGSEVSGLGSAITIVTTFALILVPFIFSGIAVTLALTSGGSDVGRLYAADLIGAALGCLAIWWMLSHLDAPSAVFAVAALAAVSALCFSPPDLKQLRLGALGIAVVFAAVATWGGYLTQGGRALLPVRFAKGLFETPPLFEKWNSFSRLRIEGDPNVMMQPFGWGFAEGYAAKAAPVRQLYLNIDATAGTPLTHFDGDLGKLAHLKHDVTNVAHHLKQDADVLVVGVGGGRDLLSALAFEQKSVTGVEINGDILRALTGPFGDFTGHLDRHSKVTLVNDEARSYIARTDRRYDIIQVSLVDTWAATSAGAFVLSENSLYTVEGWKVFLSRLKPGGMLTFSRWYNKERPVEPYRLVALAAEALTRFGVKNPRNHIMLVRTHRGTSDGSSPDGVGTILVSTEPFSAAEVDKTRATAATLGFDVAVDPEKVLDETFAHLLGDDRAAFVANYPHDISAPTDDRPFFFHMLRLRNTFNPSQWEIGGMGVNLRAVSILGVLLLLVVYLTAKTIIVPLRRSPQKPPAGSQPLFVYFGAIGTGFMLVEIAQMQRLNLFLGHPSYALCTVLFTLLLASGIGSFLTGIKAVARRANGLLIALVATLVVSGLFTPAITDALAAQSTNVRILAAVAILFPMGLLMGTAFPLGMKWAGGHAPALRPWLWGINGATSVCASVLAIAISLALGISVSYWSGVFCYVVAIGAVVYAARATRTEARPAVTVTATTPPLSAPGLARRVSASIPTVGDSLS